MGHGLAKKRAKKAPHKRSEPPTMDQRNFGLAQSPMSRLTANEQTDILSAINQALHLEGNTEV